MITQKEMEDNITNLEAPGFPSFDEIIEYSESGQDKKNALEYEKAYHALIEQVKDKPHDEQVVFLMSHMNEFRNMVDLFSYARDMYMFPCSDDDEILVNLMIYRYENHISILDDEYCVLTEPELAKIKYRVYEKRAIEKIAQQEEFKKNHPEEYKKQCEARTKEYKALADDMLKHSTPLSYDEFIKMMQDDNNELYED